MKTCAACKVPHPLDFFGPDKRASDGLRSSCKASESAHKRAKWASSDVYREQGKARRKAHHAKFDRERYRTDPAYRAARLATNTAWKNANPDKLKPEDPVKRRARHRLRMAVFTGRIVKPLACQSCLEVKPLQGHHEDYSRWSDVAWLCSYCHAQAHRRKP